MFKKKIIFYSLDRIKKKKALYNLIIGERSNGKTFAVFYEILKIYLETGKQGAIIRRWSEDYKKGRGQKMWAAIVAAGKLDNTEWDNIIYKSGAFYLSKYDDNLKKDVLDCRPFAFALAITDMEHDKSTSYPDVTTIVFDEFLTRSQELPDEFVLFMNALSTIIRHRMDVTIYMLGNTVNKSSCYFREMGLKNVDKLKPGDIDVYEYGESGLRVAIEYCGENAKNGGKESDVYFAFDNPKLQMITGGSWEMAIYPHLPIKYVPKDVKFEYFVIWEKYILHCEIIYVNGMSFTYIHQKTTPVKDEDKDLIFSPTPDPRRNWRRRISNPTDKIGNKIWSFYLTDNVYYQDNEVGEIMRNYLQFCGTYNIIRS